MNRLNLRQRLLLLSLLPSALLAILLVAYFTWSGIQNLETELKSRGLAIIKYLAPVSEYGVISGNAENLQSLLQATVQQPNVKSAVIVHRSGRTLAVTGHVSLSAEQLKSTVQSSQIVAQSERWLAFGAPIQRSLADMDLLFDTPEASRQPEILGMVFVEIDRNELLDRQIALLQQGVALVCVVFLLAAILAIAIADSLARPIGRLVRAVEKIADGELETRVPIASSGEIGKLEQGFNAMAVSIAESQTHLQERIEEATAQLAYQARHDPMTGLANRREFEALLDKALAAIRASGGESTVLFIDLDRFKPVNDSCGHAAGDELLRQIAQLLRSRLRSEDTIARIGGDEFGVLLPGCAAQRGFQVAEDLCKLTAAHRFIWGERIFSIGASIGMVAVCDGTLTISDIFSAGDSACYAAKEEGKGQVCQARPANIAVTQKPGASLHERIAQVLKEGKAHFLARPLLLLSPQADAPHVAEITLRLEQGSETAIPLNTLLAMAARHDLATVLEQQMLDLACSSACRAADNGHQLLLLMAMSATSIRRRTTIATVRATLEKFAVDGKHLYIQITEEAAVQNASQTAEFCAEMRKLGCRILLDEFGGGFASFSHLRSLRPDGIRLARTLTRDLAVDKSALAIVRAIQEIAVDLGIETIASGIDDLESADIVRHLGITWGDGAFVAPQEPFEHWLEGAVLRP